MSVTETKMHAVMKVALLFATVSIAAIGCGEEGGGSADGDSDGDTDGDGDGDSDSDTDSDSDSDSDLTYPIVGTGQSLCYGDLSEITRPSEGDSFFGQDVLEGYTYLRVGREFASRRHYPPHREAPVRRSRTRPRARPAAARLRLVGRATVRLRATEKRDHAAREDEKWMFERSKASGMRG